MLPWGRPTSSFDRWIHGRELGHPNFIANYIFPTVDGFVLSSHPGGHVVQLCVLASFTFSIPTLGRKEELRKHPPYSKCGAAFGQLVRTSTKEPICNAQRNNPVHGARLLSHQRSIGPIPRGNLWVEMPNMLFGEESELRSMESTGR